MVRKTKGKAGWFGQSKRHSEASVKGWNSRFGKKKVSLKDVKKIHAKRSNRARSVDNVNDSKIVGKNRYAQWVKNPARFDVKGVDSNRYNRDLFVKFINWHSRNEKYHSTDGQKIVNLIDKGKIKTFNEALRKYKALTKGKEPSAYEKEMEELRGKKAKKIARKPKKFVDLFTKLPGVKKAVYLSNKGQLTIFYKSGVNLGNLQTRVDAEIRKSGLVRPVDKIKYYEE